MAIDLMHAFRERLTQMSDYAFAHGFVAGFPNFHQADYGTGTVCGSYLLRSNVAEWRDVPLSDLGDLGSFAVSDVPATYRAVNDWKDRNGIEAAFPTMHRGGGVCGVITLKPGVAEWRDIPRSELDVYRIEDVPAMFRAVNDWAFRHGYAAAFPNFHQADHGNGVVYGVFLLRSGTVEWRDIYADVLMMFSRFSFDENIAHQDRMRLLERHSFAYSRINTCNNINPQEKGKLIKAYRKAIRHDITNEAKVNARAPLNGNWIRVNIGVLLPQGNDEIAQTLIHEMTHIAGYSHPKRRDADPDHPSAPFDTPGDNGPYYGTAPLRAEFCIAGRQSLTSAEAFATACVPSGNEFIVLEKRRA